MAKFGSEVLSYFDRNYFPYSFGASILATIVSFAQDHGVVIVTLIFTAIVPGIVKLIAVSREGLRNKQLLEHEARMHSIAEEKARLEMLKVQYEVEQLKNKTNINENWNEA